MPEPWSRPCRCHGADHAIAGVYELIHYPKYYTWYTFSIHYPGACKGLLAVGARHAKFQSLDF